MWPICGCSLPGQFKETEPWRQVQNIQRNLKNFDKTLVILLSILIRKNPADKCKIFKEISKTSAKYAKKFQRQVQNIQRNLKIDEISKRKKCDQFEVYLRPGAQ